MPATHPGMARRLGGVYYLLRGAPKDALECLGQADLTHPTAVGAEIIGTWIYRALMQSYQSYGKSARPPE